ncbi:hypothetical protein [Bacillus cereus group sp. BfR-BA-01425]|uniref:hypothetical protein n=1 Tax=Bacillus cereus group sp. BfR-BA-01425 TaxID=2920342 RepID=UPI001F587CCC|nr:hypothetical protein [Bacillus cereus group sp. BfR-BA-01425]
MIATRFFLGTPQVDKLQVYSVPSGRRGIVKQILLLNTTDNESKLTVTINAIDVMKDFVVGAKETKIVDLVTALESGETISLQQSTPNAINVLISGEYE